MPTGKVKWFDPKKGYGFIVGEEGRDVFVHYTSIVGDGFRALRDEELVEYEFSQGPKGDQATRVVRQQHGLHPQSYSRKNSPDNPPADGG
ncbi:MAG: cold-shock protein [Phycisphaerae bacterium]|nr:cold-shock protein [Phycisphaerae bacterium]